MPFAVPHSSLQQEGKMVSFLVFPHLNLWAFHISESAVEQVDFISASF